MVKFASVEISSAILECGIVSSQYHPDGHGSPVSISADLQVALQAVPFPANKDAIIAVARSSGVSNEVITALDGISERDYDSASAVLEQLG